MTNRDPIIAVTGLAFEAKIAAGPNVRVVCGGDGRYLSIRLQDAIDRGCRGIISFGIAGGLCPSVKPGDWVVASSVIADGVQYEADRTWSETILGAHPGAVRGIIAGSNTPVAEPKAKSQLKDQTGAIIVDMETHVVARMAEEYELPFAAFRVVADPAHRRVPHAALGATLEDGTADIGAVLRSLARDPVQLPGLISTALDARRARAALLHSRRLLGTGFCFPDIGEHLFDMA